MIPFSSRFFVASSLTLGDIAGKFFETALRLTYLERILVDVDRGEEVFADKAFVQHDSILIVVTLPRHISDLDVTTESELTGLGRVPFGEDITSLDTLTLEADRTKVNRGALVRLTELRQAVGRDRIFEAYEELVIRTVVADLDRGSVDEDYFTSALCYDLRTRVTYQLSLDTRTDDRSLGRRRGTADASCSIP